MAGNPMSAIDIARWFIAWAESIDADVTNLKLQKLLYYAQGHHLAETGQRLFKEDIEAWGHGPVVPEVYHQYKGYGSNPIDPNEALDMFFSWDDYKPIETRLLGIWDVYGSLAAWALRNKTHTEAPWREAFETGAYNEVITTERLQRFFADGV